jgi:hypothetical protein
MLTKKAIHAASPSAKTGIQIRSSFSWMRKLNPRLTPTSSSVAGRAAGRGTNSNTSAAETM